MIIKYSLSDYSDTVERHEFERETAAWFFDKRGKKIGKDGWQGPFFDTERECWEKRLGELELARPAIQIAHEKNMADNKRQTEIAQRKLDELQGSSK